MENQVMDYTFTIIEDGQVPLAGNFETFNFAPVIFVVALGIVLLAVIAYTLWIETHSFRLRDIRGNKAVFAEYFFHPIKLIVDERETEYSLVEQCAVH